MEAEQVNLGRSVVTSWLVTRKMFMVADSIGISVRKKMYLLYSELSESCQQPVGNSAVENQGPQQKTVADFQRLFLWSH